jgi:phage gp29-like protein
MKSPKKRRRNRTARTGQQTPQPVPKTLPRKGGQLIATAANDVTIPFYSNILEPQDATIREKGAAKGIKLYREIWRDGRARAALTKRITKVTRREWIVEPADPDNGLDVKAAEGVEAVLQEIGLDGASKHLLKAILNGYAVAEIVWHRNADGLIAPKFIKGHDAARFRFDRDWKPRLLTQDNGTEGIELPERKFIVHRFEAEGNNPYGLGLGSTLFWHVLFKREGVASWMVLLEKFAAPTPFGRYPSGTSVPEQDRLIDLLRNLVSNGALAAPIGTEVDFLESKRSGEAGYEAWARYWDEQTAEVVLGSTLATGVKGQGSRAASETHANETEALVDDDADALSETLNATLIRWITELNWPEASPPKVWRPRPLNETEEEEKKRKRIERQKQAIQLLDALRKQGFEPEDVKDWLAEVVETGVVPFARPDTQNDPDQPPAFADGSEDPIAHLVAQLSELAGGPLDDWLSEIRESLEGAEDFAGASKALLETSAGLEIDPMGNVLGNAFALADLTGRADVQDETGVTSSYKGSKKNS